MRRNYLGSGRAYFELRVYPLVRSQGLRLHYRHPTIWNLRIVKLRKRRHSCLIDI